MRFLFPGYLLLLLAVPPLVWLSVRSLAPRDGAAEGGPSPARRRLFLILRVAALCFLVLALSGPAVSRASTGISVVFLLDESDSVSEASRARAVAMMEAMRSRLSKDDRAALVRFGGTAEAEELVPVKPIPADGGDEVERGSTDIARAIQYSLAELPEQGSRRIVLFSDGSENRGKAAEAAALARSFGVKLFTVPLVPPPSESEVSVESILAPDRVRAGEPHAVTVVVKSRTRTPARISLFRDGASIGIREGILSAGENSIVVSSVLSESGLHAYEAIVESSADQFLENNHARKFVEVAGNPAVLYVAKKGGASRDLLSALAAQGINVVERDAAKLPGTIQGFVPFDGIILDNVPGFSLSFEKMQTIEEYVRDLGGGLLMIGGDGSFGAGGYYKTPIERALPVDMDVKSQVQMPRLTLVILADKSGSMGGPVPTGEIKLDVVKSAAFAAMELLNPFDRTGLLAFDASWEWTVPVTEAGKRDRIVNQLSTLSPGGGTDLFPAMQEAERALAASTSALKHVIIISDGLTQEAEFEETVRRMSREKITVSAIAVGQDADKELLARIAKWGGGRYYETMDPLAVPRIFVSETLMVSRGLIIEKRFIPQPASASEILKGIPLRAMPPLDGFVLTYLKNGAEKGLNALYDAPLLASWRYGLGKAAAFTSDLRGKWGKLWIQWEEYPRFAAQLARWIQRPRSFGVLHPLVRLAAGKGEISVDALDELSTFVNALDLHAVVLGPGGDREEVALSQKAPGLYEGSFRAEKAGDYAVTLAAVDRPDLPARTIGVNLSYPDEYRDSGVNAGLLAQIAAATGGKLLSLQDASRSSALPEEWEGLFRRESRGSVEPSPLWPYLVLAALLAFFFDIAARKLVLPEGLRGRLAALFKRKAGTKDFSYGELTRMVASAKEEEKKKLRVRITDMAKEGRVDKDLAAYLYIARLRGKAREKDGEKKES